MKYRRRKKAKKMIVTLATILLLATVVATGAKAATQFKAFVDVQTRLNLREGPGTNYNIIGKLLPGEVVDICGNSEEDWVRVITKEGKEGYVSRQYLEFTELIDEGSNILATVKITAKNSSENRNFNMSKACEAINGLELLPGEEFDWFEVVGEASVARGYKEAPVIKNKKSVMGEGGGVCQVSTALYNCINNLGIVPTEHHHHSLKSSYVKDGMDATVSYPDLNFVFKNTLDYAITFEAYAEKGQVVVTAYRER